MNENVFVIDEASSERPGESGGKHEYQTRDGKELVCRRCNRVYHPPVVVVTPPVDPTKIENHEGKKYLRRIYAAVAEEGTMPAIYVDVYGILEAFKVTCPAIQHCLKKLLAAGTRNKGSVLDDLQGALAALHRAIELQRQREITPRQ